MNKTEMRIERDFYSFVKTSNLGMAVKGDVYRSEMRPPEAVTEDLVVKFLAGVDGQFQSGVMFLMSSLTRASLWQIRDESENYKSYYIHL